MVGVRKERSEFDAVVVTVKAEKEITIGGP